MKKIIAVSLVSLFAGSAFAGALVAQTGGASTCPPSTQNFEKCLPFLPGKPEQKSMLLPSQTPAMTYVLAATPETMQWGFFDSSQKPVLQIKSGDSVAIETLMAAANQIVPGVPIQDVVKMANAVPGRGPHSVTGPIYVDGAEPGDVLQIHFNKILPRPYASNDNLPIGENKGVLPDVFPQGQIKYFYLDLKKMQTEFSPGIVVPLHPFPGIIAVARAEPGKYNTSPPGPFGGNLDLREMTEGTTLYLPVFMKGALLWTGDSHAGQGNGEINLTALETAFQEFNITVNVIKQKPLTWPRVETSTAWIAVGYDTDMNKALDILKQESMKLIVEQRKVSPAEAENILYANWNCPIAEAVNGVKGVYCIVPKDVNAPKSAALPKEDNAEFFVTYSKNADIEKAMQAASLAMVDKIVAQRNLTALDAYSLASITMDCRIGLYKGGDKEISCMMPKSLWVSK